jgi:outer membrane biosynthesis protein TonB
MYVILFLVAIVVAFAGATLVFFSVPLQDIAAAALFCSGVVAIVGGLILLGLAAAVHNLSRIAERLEIQPLPLPSIVAVGHETPSPRPVRSAPTAAPAAAKRPSILSSWLNRPGPAVKEEPKPPPAPSEPQVDLAPLTRVPEEQVAAPPLPPPAPAASAPLPAAPAAAAAPAPPAPPPAPAPPAAPLIPRAVVPPLRPAAQPAPVARAQDGGADSTVYKSGVIDGMAYSLFMDGSIEAELPQGKVRFASVDQLQTYLTTRP